MAEISEIKSQLENNPLSFDLESIKQVPQELDKVIAALAEIRAINHKLGPEQERILNLAIKYRNEVEKTVGELSKGENALEKWGTNADKFGNTIRGLGTALESPIRGMERLGGAWGKADQAANDFGKTIGANTKAVGQLRDESIKFANDVHIGEKYNASISDMIKLQQELSKTVGRNLQLSNNQRETLLATSKLMKENTNEFIKRLENMGVGLERSGDIATKMFNEASKSGISFEKYSKTVTENLTKVQSYGFKNGVEGLTAMAKKAAEVNLNIGEAFKVAGKIETGGVQEAIKMGANLQVLGGSFARFGDPLNMLYEGLNDMEGLQERMINMFSGMGQLKDGQVQLSTANRLRAKTAAQALGISSDEMFNMINRQAVRDTVKTQMGGRFNGDDELKELILNTATLNKNNEAVVNIRGEERKLSEIDAKDKQYLKDLQKTEAEDIKDIAQMLRGYEDVQQGFTKEVENKKAQAFANIGKVTKMIYDKLGQSNIALEIIKDAALAMTLAQTAGSLLSGIGRVIPGKGGGNVAGSVGGGGTTASSAVANGGLSSRNARRLNKTFGEGNWEIRNDGSVYALDKNGNPVRNKVTSGAERNIARSSAKAGKVAKFAKFAGSGVGRAIGGGAAGGAFAALGYLADGSFGGSQSDKVKAGYGTAGAVAGGALGSLLTPFIGPLGPIIGSELGKWGGEALGKVINKGRENKKKELTDELNGVKGKSGENVSEAFAKLSDNYSRDQLKKIKAALADGSISDGELSDKILKKMAMNGDKDLIEKFGTSTAKTKINEQIEKINAKIEKGNFNMDTGEFSIGNANFGMIEPVAMASGGKLNGPSDINGPGMPIQGTNIVVGGGEYVVNAEATKRNEALLNRINSGETIKMDHGGFIPAIKSIVPSILKNPMTPLPVRAVMGAMNMLENRGSGSNKMEVAPIKLDISGVVKLDAGGQQVDLNAIVNNPAFITQLSQMIERRLADNINGGNFKELKKNKQHTF